jgi:acyl-CoA synthetase (AMP-forming)/AMP-acid ligase II
MKVVDDSDAEVATGKTGEILVRGYNVMKGYFEEPDETARAITPDGWLRTGDIGFVDADGYVKITDRKKDMFIVGGFNAYPAEIERLLLASGLCAQVAVIGVPDDRLGEVGAAFVVPAQGRSVSADDIVGWARSHIANFKVPRHVFIVEALPLNASMKVLKPALRSQAADLLLTNGERHD